jgi:hypothetical protein
MNTNWLKQTVNSPLFEGLIWSRPETKQYAGKVVVIGGNLHSFSKTVNSYSLLLSAGLGQVTVLLPKPIQKIIGHISTDLVFCPSTDSGSFGSEALYDLVDYSSASDGVFLSGELSSNSETLIVFEKLVSLVSKIMIITDDSIDLILHIDVSLINRTNMIYVGSLDKIQKLATKLQSPDPITSSLALSNLVEILQKLTQDNKLSLATIHQGYVVIASSGDVSTTKIENSSDKDIFKLVHHTVAWTIQNPDAIFNALSCAAITYQTI